MESLIITAFFNPIVCTFFSVSIIVISFAEYAAAPFYPGRAAPEVLKKCLAIIALAFITIVNGLSVKAAQTMQIFFIIPKFVFSFLMFDAIFMFLVGIV